MNDDNANVQKYVQFPLCYLQEIAVKPKESIEKAISFGIMKYALKTKYTISDIARQILYDYYQNKVNGKVERYLIKHEIEKDEDYKGFVGKEFEPEDLQRLVDILKNQPNDDCVEHYQLHLASQFLKVTIGSKTSENYKEVSNYLSKHEQMNGKQPFPSIGLSILFSFRDNPENIELLLAYISIKSLIGRDEFGITTKAAIIMRMIGAKNKEALQEACKNKVLKDIYDKYFKRYWSDKLLNELQLKGFIKSKIGIYRRIWISTQLDYQQLEAAIINHRNSIDIKKKEKEAKNRILQHLYNGNK